MDIKTTTQTTIQTVSKWFDGIDVMKTSLLVAGLLIAALVIGFVVKRLRKPSIASVTDSKAARGICARLWAYVLRFLDAIDYLATRREWRYEQPWMLVLGEQGAGKSSLIASVSSTLRHRAPAKAAQLKAEGMRWVYFRNGVLIDADGALAAAEEGSDTAALWRKGLAQLDALRPERALDGVLVCVSARTLHAANQAQRAALADNVNRQISQLQANVEFMLPAYVVVTQCDAVPGFSAFWQNQDASRWGDMIGYSAMAQDQTLPPTAWAETAFDKIGARLREIQVDVAAHSEQIVDVDNFFLFPGHLRTLREPLSQWLETVFRTTAWQSGYLFRGMYFTGSIDADGTRVEGVRSDVNFVDALLSEKTLREPALARPTRQGIWSRNRLIRRIQMAAVVGTVALFVALGFASNRVSNQVDGLLSGLTALDKASALPVEGSGYCPSREDIYPLLEQVAQIDTRSRYVVIPLSWIDGRMTTRSARKIGASTVQGVLMPTLSCLLEARSRELLGTSVNPLTTETATLSAQRASFRALVTDVRALEDNLERFETLSLRSNTLSSRQVLDTLDQLALYTFGAPLPDNVKNTNGVLDEAIQNLTDVKPPVLPNGLHRRLSAAIEARSARARTALSNEVSMGDDLLEALSTGQVPILDNTRRMGVWLTWVQSAWLGSSDERNPCLDIVNANQGDLKALMASHGEYVGLVDVLHKFDKTSCYLTEMRVLREMALAPYGPLFVPVPGNGGLKLEPKLQNELSGMPALVVLPFMQLTAAAPFECAGGAVTWRASEIAEAAGYLKQYETFAKAHPAPQLPHGGRPLYDTLARQSVARAIDDALRRAQQPPAAGSQTAGSRPRSDAPTADVSAELTLGLKSLQTVLNAYSHYALAGGGTDVRQCARNFAADYLGSVDALAEGSRLYAPPVAVGQDAMYALGNLPVTKDFLARQVGRAQVLAGYAKPFLSLLTATTDVDDAWRDTPQTADFWRNTLDEIDSYTKGKEPTGQVANLDTYFISQLTGMTYSNCAATLSAYKAPEYGNDLFSARRQKLERQVQLRCSDQRQAQAEEVYNTLAARFNRDLAGRYPFGEVAARDADTATVRAFFLDYANQREAIGAALRDMDGKRWASANAFVAQLDKAAAFFATNISAPGQMDVVGVNATFPADTAKSAGADQLVEWRLSVEDRASVFPNASKTLDWFPGESLALELRWADRSPWRPVADPAQSDLNADNAIARFDASGPWALLRFIDLHRVRTSSESAPILLSFRIPVQGTKPAEDGKAARDEAKVFMTWRLTGVDAKTQANGRITYPMDVPRSAPAD